MPCKYPTSTQLEQYDFQTLPATVLHTKSCTVFLLADRDKLIVLEQGDPLRYLVANIYRKLFQMRTASAKGNSARKILSFYRVNFAFTPPYKVLCDGETLALSFKNDLYLKQALPKLLGSITHIVVTECIVHHLRKQGEDYSNAALFAKRATRIPCAHEGHLSVTECITARLQKPFDLKLMLASNDLALLSSISNTPGIPLVTIANNTKLVLKPPTRFTLEFVKGTQKEKSNLLTTADKAMIDQVRAQEVAARSSRKILIPRKKKAKGPNPLSMRKAKNVPARPQADVDHDHTTSGAHSQRDVPTTDKIGGNTLKESNMTGESLQSKRKRKRKRPNKSGGQNKEVQRALQQDVAIEPVEPPKEISPPMKRRRTQHLQSDAKDNERNIREENTSIKHGDNASAHTTIPVTVKTSVTKILGTVNVDLKKMPVANVGKKEKTDSSQPKVQLGNLDSQMTTVAPGATKCRGVETSSAHTVEPIPCRENSALEHGNVMRKDTVSTLNEPSGTPVHEIVEQPGTLNRLKSENVDVTDKDGSIAEEDSVPNKSVQKKQRKNRRRRPKKVPKESSGTEISEINN